MKALFRRSLVASLAVSFLIGSLDAEDLSEIAAATRELRQTLRDLDKRMLRLEKLLNQEASDRKKQRKVTAAATPLKETAVKELTIRIDPAADLLEGQDLYRRARVEESAQQFEKAIELYTQAVHFDPKNDLAFLHRGISSLRIGRADQALSDANQSLAIQPNSAQGYAFRGSVYLSIKSYDQALSDLKEASLRDSENSDYILTQAAAEEERGNLKGAVELYEKASKLRPESAEIWVKSANALRQTGDSTRAADQCARAITLMPTSAEGYMCRAESYLRGGALLRAMDDLNQAFSLQPTMPQVAKLLPVVKDMIQVNEDFTRMKSAQDQLANQAKIATPAPQPPQIEPKQPPPPQAVEAPKPVEERVVEKPDPPKPVEPKASREALRDGRKSLEKGKFQEALDSLGKAIELDPHSAIAYNSRGYAYLRTRQYDLAIRDFSIAISINSAYANAYWNRSAARRLCGDVPGSRQDIELATKLGYPTNIAASGR